MRFSGASGMATWCRDNLAVRYQQAVHINPGSNAEEAPLNEVVAEGDHQIFRCDLPLLDAAHAADAYATLSAITSWVVAEPDDTTGPSYIEQHTCHHDETPRQPCEVVSRVEVRP